MAQKNYTISELKEKGKVAGQKLTPFAYKMLMVLEKNNLIGIDELNKGNKKDRELGEIVLTIQLLAFYYLVLDNFVHATFRPVEHRAMMESVDDELRNEINKMYGQGSKHATSLNKSLWGKIERWKRVREASLKEGFEGPDPVLEKFGDELYQQFGFKIDVKNYLEESYIPVSKALLEDTQLNEDFLKFIKGLY